MTQVLGPTFPGSCSAWHAGFSAATFRETTVVSFVPCSYFLFLTVVAAVIIGLFNISERVRQYPSPRIESNVIATKKEPRLFMFASKTKHGLAASKTASSASAPTAKADAKKSKHHKAGAGSNGGF